MAYFVLLILAGCWISVRILRCLMGSMVKNIIIYKHSLPLVWKRDTAACVSGVLCIFAFYTRSISTNLPCFSMMRHDMRRFEHFVTEIGGTYRWVGSYFSLLLKIVFPSTSEFLTVSLVGQLLHLGSFETAAKTYIHGIAIIKITFPMKAVKILQPNVTMLHTQQNTESSLQPPPLTLVVVSG